MTSLRFATIGAGFWAKYQLAAWQELADATCVAIHDRAHDKAEALARAYNVPAIYDDPAALLQEARPDFIDVITSVESHSHFVHLAAEHGVPVICQKPLAPDLATAEAMVERCRRAGVPLFVHENWRWQWPIRQFKSALEGGRIGVPFRARIHYCSSFPVFANQPFLAELEQFILTDIGSHILDVARFLFGEAQELTCRTHHVHRDLKRADVRGEDVATVMMTMQQGDQYPITVTCEMSYASRTEIERFPETYIYVEGSEGFLELGPDFWLRETTAEGTWSRRTPPPRYAWADPAYDVVQSSMVPCNANFLAALQGRGHAETTGEDNLRTVRLVFAAYESAASHRMVHFDMNQT